MRSVNKVILVGNIGKDAGSGAMKRVRMLGSWDAIGGLRTEKGVA